MTLSPKCSAIHSVLVGNQGDTQDTKAYDQDIATVVQSRGIRERVSRWIS